MPPPSSISALEVLLADGEPTTNVRLATTLPADATAFELPAPHRPAEGEEVLVAVRLVDGEDRPAAVSRWRRLRRVGEALRPMPPRPLHPRRADWPVRIVADAAELVLCLPAPPLRLGCSSVKLQRREESGALIELLSLDAGDLPAVIVRRVNLIAGGQRFRWVLVLPLGDRAVGPWSADVQPTDFAASFDGVSLGAQTS